jgi:GH15 family glucan-1,4-alpha-glucosidase
MRPQTFSTLMCWAAADRAARVAERWKPGAASRLGQAATHLRERILKESWSAERKAFVADLGGKEMDAAVLQMVPLRFLPRDDKRLHATVDAIVKELSRGGWLLRYTTDDGLGHPHTAFVICTFWLAEALALLDRADEGRAALNLALGASSPIGLLAEDFDPQTKRLWGNFPQAYSHVGLIHAAFRVSEKWSDVL